MKQTQTFCSLLLPQLLSVSAHTYADATTEKQLIDRGRYRVATSGCNDCHTPGYAQSGGAVPESAWLVGSPVRLQGPWGTTYSVNLRLLLAGISEDQWLTKARSEMRSPIASA